MASKSRTRPLIEPEWRSIASSLRDVDQAMESILRLVGRRCSEAEATQVFTAFGTLSRRLRTKFARLASEDGCDGGTILWEGVPEPLNRPM